KATATILISDPTSPSVVGQAFTVTATLTGVGGAPLANEHVSIDDHGNNPSCFDVTDANRHLSCLSTETQSRPVLTTALFAGNANYHLAEDVESHLVNPASTSTAVSGSPNPSVFGSSVTFTATVTAVAPGAGIPSGSVSFTI